MDLEKAWGGSYEKVLLSYNFELQQCLEFIMFDCQVAASMTALESRTKGLCKLLKLLLEVVDQSRLQGTAPFLRFKVFYACRKKWVTLFRYFETVLFNVDAIETVKTEERKLALEVLVGALILYPPLCHATDPSKMIQAVCTVAVCQENIFDTQSYKIGDVACAYIYAIKAFRLMEKKEEEVKHFDTSPFEQLEAIMKTSGMNSVLSPPFRGVRDTIAQRRASHVGAEEWKKSIEQILSCF
jgi:hypothetical protein